jgi:hypothetical protein
MSAPDLFEPSAAGADPAPEATPSDASPDASSGAPTGPVPPVAASSESATAPAVVPPPLPVAAASRAADASGPAKSHDSSKFERGAEPPGSPARLEHLLGEIRALLEQQQRVHRYREFSPARLLGALTQAFVIPMTLWALADWALAADHQAVLVKLGFAAVLQLMALSAFVLMPRDD